MAGRILRLLLALLVVTASGLSAGNAERVFAENAPIIQGRSSLVVVTGARAARVALQPRGSPTRQNGSGPFPHFTPVLPLDLRPGASWRIVKAFGGPPRLVLPRRLNRPLYSGTPPPFPG